jgi:sialic acid synthase SpsE
MRIVAEVGPCNGRIDYAIHAAVRASQAGAWGLKVQMYQADLLTLPDAPTYAHGLKVPATQHEAFRDAISPYSEWSKVKSVCDDLGLVFFASCWDAGAVDACVAMGVDLFKIGSADITHRPLIEYTARSAGEIVLSTGGSTVEEIGRAVGWIKDTNPKTRVTLLACTLAYPTDDTDANVLRMVYLQQAFGTQVDAYGYSDHTRSLTTAAVVSALGGTMLEKHMTLHPGTGSDHDFAVTPTELAQMVQLAQEGHQLLGDPLPTMSPAEEDAVTNARRSIVAAVDIPRKTRINESMLAYLRPGTGIPPYEAYKILGLDSSGPTKGPMKASVDIPAGTIVTWKMVGYISASLTVE